MRGAGAWRYPDHGRRLFPSRSLRIDRKSTRLNSSHSLHDALPICKEFCAAHGLSVHTLDAWRRRMALSGSRQEIVPVEIVEDRSEEHTSELQSLPPRRSSDLQGVLRGAWAERAYARCVAQAHGVIRITAGDCSRRDR